mgnify:CR=1 FL=1
MSVGGVKKKVKTYKSKKTGDYGLPTPHPKADANSTWMRVKSAALWG